MTDPFGHALLRRRLKQIPDLLVGMLGDPPRADPKTLKSTGFIVTGTGSSEAHARFLVNLLNRYADRPAEFVPLSGFCASTPIAASDQTLVVVSQGLSPNAQVAINEFASFAHTIVFTATTAEGAAAAGKTARAQLIRDLESAGVEFIRGPLEEEYSTLIRFVGPMACFLSTYLYSRSLKPDALPPVTPQDLRHLLASEIDPETTRTFITESEHFKRGFYLIAGAPLCETAQNLGYKFLEGLFWSSPAIWDYLQFAHGPFQEVSLHPRPVVILEGPGDTEAELASRTRDMLESVSLPHITITGQFEPPLSILEFEATFNTLIMHLIEHFKVDQINWPSKGKDDPLYGFYRMP
ncbi:MAG: creatininase [Verrucomicrobia bacterium]|nr:MAG: creatininase [Verrucomicrobiota bacterium]